MNMYTGRIHRRVNKRGYLRCGIFGRNAPNEIPADVANHAVRRALKDSNFELLQSGAGYRVEGECYCTRNHSSSFDALVEAYDGAAALQ